MKLNVVIGNIFNQCNSKLEYDYLKQMLDHCADTVKIITPEQWLEIVLQYGNDKGYAEIKYCKLFDNNYFINQINNLVLKIERENKQMNDSLKLLILISKQLTMLSEKVDALSEKIDNLADDVDMDSLRSDLEDMISSNIDIDADSIANSIVEALDIDNLM